MLVANCASLSALIHALARLEGATKYKASALITPVGTHHRYLEAALQKLRRAGIVSGQRGPAGGYMLARPLSGITLLDLMRIISTHPGSKETDDAGPTQLRAISQAINDRVAEALQTCTVADIAAFIDPEGEGD